MNLQNFNEIKLKVVDLNGVWNLKLSNDGSLLACFNYETRGIDNIMNIHGDIRILWANDLLSNTCTLTSTNPVRLTISFERYIYHLRFAYKIQKNSQFLYTILSRPREFQCYAIYVFNENNKPNLKYSKIFSCPLDSFWGGDVSQIEEDRWTEQIYFINLNKTNGAYQAKVGHVHFTPPFVQDNVRIPAFEELEGTFNETFNKQDKLLMKIKGMNSSEQYIL